MGHVKGRDFANGWVSSLSRNIVLGIGWILVAGALSAAVIGLIIGAPVLSVVGTLTGLLAWTLVRVNHRGQMVTPIFFDDKG